MNKRVLATLSLVVAAAFLAGTLFGMSNRPFSSQQDFDFLSIQSAEAVVDTTGPIEIFANFDGISGESVSMGHADEIDISSYRFDVNQDPDPISGAPEGASIFRDFVLVKRLDKSSPFLFVKAADKEHIEFVEVSVRKVGSSEDFLKFRLTDVKINSYGDNSQGQYPYEAVTLQYSRIQLSYQPLNPDGSPDGPPIKKGWDLVRNQELTLYE